MNNNNQYAIKVRLIINIVIYIVFTIIYMRNKHFFNKKNITTSDIAYFSSITHSTVGYGDIMPITKMGKLLTSIHIMLVFFTNIII